jgi:hypothetical protein
MDIFLGLSNPKMYVFPVRLETYATNSLISLFKTLNDDCCAEALTLIMIKKSVKKIDFLNNLIIITYLPSRALAFRLFQFQR